MTKEQIQNFYQQYYENETLMSQAENKLFEPVSSPEEWIARLKERSKISRALYCENLKLIDETLGEIRRHPEVLSEELFETIRTESYKALVDSRLDSKVGINLSESLLHYMQGHSFLPGREYQVKQMRSDAVTLSMVENQYQEDFKYIWGAVSNLNLYETYDIKHKEQAIRSNYNAYVLECVYTEYTYQQIVELGEKLLAFISRPDVIEDCNHFERVKYEHYVYLIKMNMVEVYCNKYDVEPETLAKIQRYAEELQAQDPEHKDLNLTCYALFWQYVAGKLNAEQYFEIIYDYYCHTDARPKYFEAVTELDELKEVPNSFYIAADVAAALDLTEYSYEKKCILYQSIVERFLSSLQSVKRGRFDATLSDFIQKFILCMSGYCGKKEELLDIVKNIYIKQQIQTFLHTVMVERIATMISDAMLEQAPELFFGFEELNTREAVIKNQKRLKEYVKYAAMLHDIGKVSISDIVNMQTRKISNSEFERIKKHPEFGAFLVEQFPMIREYIDVILGHHKYYDGTIGYPEEFDNLHCLHKPVVDLISICDSMDAATDILGRNYTTGKTFEQLMEELEAGSGTRYSSEIVSFLQKSEDLRTRLKNLVTEQREQVYFEVYSNYFTY